MRPPLEPPTGRPYRLVAALNGWSRRLRPRQS
jgi:hypothetical protein